ncbi:MAG: protein-L-isoaspartate(D-aspartate) O-methyltransferase [Burkholderiaceae bacterium]|nr:protein-L-isoaspartate(D-aspartate) O-methyltransferase [Burkholderiaceae bacterium]
MSERLGNVGLASERVRARMVERVRELGVRDPRVLGALDAVPRHAFLDPALASRAYEDTALPIGHGQTISQPYIVARTAELALDGCVDPKAAKVLEVGTGCGYAAAVLARLFGTVITVERVRALHELARNNLRPLRIANLRLVFGDGFDGVPSEAPFDAITAAAAGEDVPPAWLAQLRPGGRIVAPLGGADQSMVVIVKDEAGRISRRNIEAVRFVPLRTGTT